MTQAAVLDATDATFAEEVLARSHEIPVVVDFWAAWCGPCRIVGPILESVASDFEGRVQLVKVDVDSNPQVASGHQIRGIPAVKAFRDGEMVAEFVGARPEPAVREFFEGLMPSDSDRLAEEGDRALEGGEAALARAHFETALLLRPEHAAASLGLARALLELGDLAGAEKAASPFPRDPGARRLLARIGLLRAAQGVDRDQASARLAADPADIEARYQLGSAMLAAGEWEVGFEHLLEVVMRDRKYQGDGGRLRILDGIEQLAEEDPLAQAARRRLTNLLF